MNKNLPSTLRECASQNDQYICCRTLVTPIISGCPFNCTYCFLQDYLKTDSITTIDDIKTVADAILSYTNKNLKRFFRIGTWPLGDSLAIDRFSKNSIALAEYLSDKTDNLILEAKTKSSNIYDLLNKNLQKIIFISFSLNPQTVISKYEDKTASLNDRIKAMQTLASKGYKIGLHLDPIIYISNLEKEYHDVIYDIFDKIDYNSILLISLGTVRFNQSMKYNMQINFKDTDIIYQEFVKGLDGLFRYPKPVRIDIYKKLYSQIKEITNNTVPVYLCMERDSTIKEVFKEQRPTSSAHLDYMIAESIHRRFPEILTRKPDIKDYIS